MFKSAMHIDQHNNETNLPIIIRENSSYLDTSLKEHKNPTK